MKIDKYYIAGGVAILVILIVVFTQRSDWDATRHILSSDSEGNLTPISESYFEGEEQRLIGVVNAKLAEVNASLTALSSRVSTNANTIVAEANHAHQSREVIAARAEQIDQYVAANAVLKHTSIHLRNRGDEREPHGQRRLLGAWGDRGGFYHENDGGNLLTHWYFD